MIVKIKWNGSDWLINKLFLIIGRWIMYRLVKMFDKTLLTESGEVVQRFFNLTDILVETDKAFYKLEKIV